MSKYNSGDKFVIEVDTAFGLMGGNPLYTIKGFNALVFDDYGLDRLQKYGEIKETLELLTEAKQDDYNKGLQDAWELARQIVLDDGMECDTFMNIFGTYSGYEEVLRTMTPQEALAKIEAYEKSQQIEVGDVVHHINSDEDAIVVCKCNDGRYKLMFGDFDISTNKVSEFKKTGRHIDISSLLEQIRGNE